LQTGIEGFAGRAFVNKGAAAREIFREAIVVDMFEEEANFLSPASTL
jgi:hypothetical protein